MAERNALMPGQGTPRERNALAPDTQADGSPDPNATAGWQQLYRDWQARGADMPPLGEWLRGAGSEYAHALLMGSTAPGVRAFHGSPHSFERFDLGKIGTGEGAQAYGHGLYFAEKEGVARSYRDALRWNGLDWNDPQYVAGFWLDASKGNAEAAAAHLESSLKHQGTPEAKAAVSGAIDLLRNGQSGINAANPGHMYEVNIGSDPEHFLHWDKPLSEQPNITAKLPQQVRDELLGVGEKSKADWGDLGVGTNANEYATGQSLIKHLTDKLGDPAAASQALQDAGIPGIRYLDQGSRGAGEGSHNLVVFDPETIEILRKYGLAGLGLGGAAAAQQSDGTQ